MDVGKGFRGGEKGAEEHPKTFPDGVGTSSTLWRSGGTAGWRVGLPFQKTRGTTGQVTARVPRSWCRAVGVWDHVRTLHPGQRLASPAAVLALQKHLKGNLNVFRRSAISIRVLMGHSPTSIRQATMHTSDKIMHSYVGITELLGKASAPSRRM